MSFKVQGEAYDVDKIADGFSGIWAMEFLSSDKIGSAEKPLDIFQLFRERVVSNFHHRQNTFHESASRLFLDFVYPRNKTLQNSTAEKDSDNTNCGL